MAAKVYFFLSNSSKKELWIVWNEGKERRQGRCFVMMMIERRWVSDFLFYFLLAYTVLWVRHFFWKYGSQKSKSAFVSYFWVIYHTRLSSNESTPFPSACSMHKFYPLKDFFNTTTTAQ